MTTSELRATVSVDWSVNSSCAWPIDAVLIRSLRITSWPTSSSRNGSFGGCPVASGLTAAATPTLSGSPSAGELRLAKPRAASNIVRDELANFSPAWRSVSYDFTVSGTAEDRDPSRNRLETLAFWDAKRPRDDTFSAGRQPLSENSSIKRGKAGI